MSAVDPMEAIKATFFQECEELLVDLEAGLLAMQDGATDSETVNAVFRAVHSIKGGAGAFALDALVRFAHVFETLLDGVRAERIEATAELVGALLRAADLLADHVRAAQGQGEADAAATAAMAAELERLTDGAPAEADMPLPAPVTLSLEEAGDELGFDFSPTLVALDGPDLETKPAGWRVTFTPLPELYRKANEPLLLLRELERLGEISVSLDDSSVPLLDGLNPETPYLTWAVEVASDADETTIREVFEFVEGDCTLTVEPLGVDAPAADGFDISALLASAQAPIDEAPAEASDARPSKPPPYDISALLAAAGAPVSPPEPAAVVADPPAPIPAAAPAAPAEPAAAGGGGGGKAPATPAAAIRVDPERIDRLIDLVGELVINQAMLAARMAESGVAPSSALATGLEELEALTRGIQDGVMAIRAQPVKSVFQRMPRLVREVASMTGKQVKLVTEGENTEVDKTVIERLSDPITHMLRNAIDHGLETPDERIAAGKPAEGVVKLAALHRGGRIVIEVRDDGRGINRPRVRKIAEERGLVSPEAVLTDEETDNLIFLPGFSTAEAVSDISGRGVGMDVVRRSVQALGGRISISSRPGLGSTFTLSLPLTLAVLDGMVVDVGGQTLVAPLTAIVESLRPSPDEVRAFGPSGSVLDVRGALTPLLDVGVALGYRAEPIDPAGAVVILVEDEDRSRAALVVDAIQGQRQVVIKSLEANYGQVEGIAAATILGDGRVALILDVDALISKQRRESPPSRPQLHAAE